MENSNQSQLNMSKLQRGLLLWMTVGLSALLILRDVGGIGLSKYIFIGYILLFMALANYRTVIYMACFVFPLTCGLPSTYIMLGTLILLAIKRGGINAQQFYAIVFVAAWELLASIWYVSWDLIETVKYVSFAGVMFFLILDNREPDYKQCVRMYLFGVILLCLVIVVATLKNAPSNWLYLFSKGWFRFGKDITDNEGVKLTLNANSLAYYALTGTICGIFMAENEQGKKKILYVIIAILCTMTGFLTLSRSWMLVVVICLLLYALKKLHTLKRFIGFALVGMAAVLVCIWFFGENPELWSGLVTRATRNDITGANGRMNILLDYMHAFFKKPRYVLLGTGVNETLLSTNMYQSMHNGLQQILICYGVPGFVVFILFLVKPVWNAFMGLEKENRLIYCLPFIGVVLFVQTIQFLNPMMLMLPYIIGVYAMKVRGNNREEIHCDGGYRG